MKVLSTRGNINLKSERQKLSAGGESMLFFFKKASAVMLSNVWCSGKHFVWRCSSWTNYYCSPRSGHKLKEQQR